VGERIRQQLDNLTSAERRVARVLLGGPATVGLDSSARLAAASGVSGPTVSRFVTHLGFASYGDFQTAWRHELDERMLSPVKALRRHAPQRTEAELVRSSSFILVDSLTETLEHLSLTALQPAIHLLADPKRRVWGIGGWFSHHVAAYLIGHLRELRTGVCLISQSAADRAGAVEDATKSDVLVAFDFRRYESATRRVAEGMHKKGTRVVLFTDTWLSPIAEIADTVLPAALESPSPFESLTPTLAVVEVLLTGIFEALGERGRQRFESFGMTADPWLSPWPTASADRSAERP